MKRWERVAMRGEILRERSAGSVSERWGVGEVTVTGIRGYYYWICVKVRPTGGGTVGGQRSREPCPIFTRLSGGGF